MAAYISENLAMARIGSLLKRFQTTGIHNIFEENISQAQGIIKFYNPYIKIYNCLLGFR